jgi:hypothetical protein
MNAQEARELAAKSMTREQESLSLDAANMIKKSAQDGKRSVVLFFESPGPLLASLREQGFKVKDVEQQYGESAWLVSW